MRTSLPRTSLSPPQGPALQTTIAILSGVAYAFALSGSVAGGVALACVTACASRPFAEWIGILAAGATVFWWTQLLIGTTIIQEVAAIFLLTVALSAAGFFAFRKPVLDDSAPLSRALRHWPRATGRPWLACIAVLAALGLGVKAFPIRDCLLWIVAALVTRSRLPKPEPREFNLRNAAATAALFAVSLGVTAAILEWGAGRFVFPNGRSGFFFRADPDSLFTLRPNARGFREFEKEKDQYAPVWWEVSAQGFRDDPVPPKPPDEFRVVLIGDSFTFGVTVEFDDTIGQHLQRILRERHPSRAIRVVNLGVPGYGPWQERRRLLSHGFGLDPDLVIQQLFLENDVANELASVNIRLESYLEPWEATVERFKRNSLTRFRLETGLWIHSDAYAAFSNAIGRDAVVSFLASGTRILPVAPLSVPPPHGTNRPPEIEINLAHWYPALETGWKMLLDTVEGTYADCTQRDVPYAVYNIPSVVEVVDARWHRTLAQLMHRVEYDRAKPDSMLMEEFAKCEIPHIPLKPRLLEAPNRDSLYFAYDAHFTPEGNEFVAGVLADYIDRTGLLAQQAH